MSDQMDTQGSTLYQPVPLLDLAAQAIAKHFSASVLDSHKEYLDEALMKKVAYYSFPQNIRSIEIFPEMIGGRLNWERGLKLEEENGVKEMYQIGFMVTAYLSKLHPTYFDFSHSGSRSFSPSGPRSPGRPGLRLITDMNTYQAESGEIKVSILVERQKILKCTCSMCPKSYMWCEHVYAASIYRIKYPEKVTMHAPMTESLSSLSRDQLQKLLQYAADEDPAGVMGKIFKRYKINQIDGAPDPSFGGLRGGERSQWDRTLDSLYGRFAYVMSHIIDMTANDDIYGKINYVHPDTYDLILKKKKSMIFSFVPYAVEFVKQKEYLLAADVMRCFIRLTTLKMDATTRSACPSLSRWWHDLSHIHALLVLRTEDKEARNVLMNIFNEIDATEVMKEHILQTSDWSELPTLTQLFPHETETLSREGCMMIESVLANQLQPNPRDLCRLLDGTDNCENTSYNVDLIIMLARLESLFYFDKDQQKITRLGFLILHKLSMQTQQYSVLGQFVGSSSDSGAPSSLIKLFCPVSPATSTKQDPESLVSSSSSNVQPMDTDSPPDSEEGRQMTCEPSEEGPPAKRARIEPLLEGKSKPPSEFVWTSRHLTYAMLHTLYIIIDSQEETSTLDSDNRKLLVGFCLQALELSKHRMGAIVTVSNENSNVPVVGPSSQSETSMHTFSNQSESSVISKIEYEWLKALEGVVCKYLELVKAEESHEIVSMYIDAIRSAGTSLYLSEHKDSLSIGGPFPLSLVKSLCHLLNKNETLKESKSRQLVKICSEILLDSTGCQMYNSLLNEKVLEKLLVLGTSNKPHLYIQNFQPIFDKFCKDVVVQNFHAVIEMLHSTLDTESPEDNDLLNKIHNHLQNVRCSALLRLISAIVGRVHYWRFQDHPGSVYYILEKSIRSYEEILGVSNPDAASSSLSFALNTLGSDDDYYTTGRVIEKDLIYFLFKKLGLSSLAIFSKVWQDIFTCTGLQDLFLDLEETDNKKNFSSQGAGLTPELLAIIDEFYDSKLPHDEDACTLLTRYFTSGSDPFKRITRKIVNNAENFTTEALFYLAKLNLSVISHNPVLDLDSKALESVNSSQTPGGGFGNMIAAMDDEKFEIVEKAFERLGSIKPTSGILGAVEWVFNSCVMFESVDITRLQFYDKLIQCICKHVEYQPQIILKILQRIDFICGGIDSSYLAQHQSIKDLRVALIECYKKYFGYWSSYCKNKSQYSEIIREMLTAQDECKKFVPNGDIEFDKVVLVSMRVMHSISENFPFIRMLNKAFNPSDTTVNGG